MKRLVILFLAVLLVLSAVITASVLVGATQAQLTHGETVLYGDPAAADGLTLSLHYIYRSYLNWFTDYTYGSPDSSDTDFHCYAVAPNFNTSIQDYRGVVMNTVGNYLGMDHLSDIFRMELANGNTGTHTGLLGGYQKLYNDTPEGELTNTYLRIADYCEYYPLAGTMELPTGGYHWNYYSDSGYLVNGKETAETFNDYFRIPVLPDDHLQLIVDKRRGDTMEAVDISYPRQGEDWYQMDSVGVCFENTAYFTFDALTEKGNVVDTSLIPGGYGLYSVDFNNRGSVDCTTLTTCMPLDPAYEPSDMTVDGEFRNLHYFSTRDGSMYLTVIDLDTMEVLQHICIWEEKEETWRFYKQQDNCIIVHTSVGGLIADGSISVWQKNDRGLYDYKFTAPTREENSGVGLYDAQFAFDGERLAVVNRHGIQSAEYENVYTHMLCGYSLSIYTAEGCAYRGLYTSSLEAPENTGHKEHCYLRNIQAVQVAWQ